MLPQLFQRQRPSSGDSAKPVSMNQPTIGTSRFVSMNKSTPLGPRELLIGAPGVTTAESRTHVARPPGSGPSTEDEPRWISPSWRTTAPASRRRLGGRVGLGVWPHTRCPQRPGDVGCDKIREPEERTSKRQRSGCAVLIAGRL